MPPANDWIEYKRLVLAELERLDAQQKVSNEQQAAKLRGMLDRIEANSKEITVLKLKAGMWGALAGFVPAMGAALWFILAR